jgi:hypothetical protein
LRPSGRWSVGGAELVPAWMLNCAWRELTERRTLTNAFLLNYLHAKRSSAVCALLARLCTVDVVTTRPVTLVLRKVAASAQRSGARSTSSRHRLSGWEAAPSGFEARRSSRTGQNAATRITGQSGSRP